MVAADGAVTGAVADGGLEPVIRATDEFAGNREVVAGHSDEEMALELYYDSEGIIDDGIR